MLRLIRDPDAVGAPDDHALALAVHQQRRFLGMEDDEPTELTFFARSRISIAHALSADSHARLLRDAHDVHGFVGAFLLVNGPIDHRVLARYRSDVIVAAANGRVTDKEITARRALYVDVDAVRPKGISATDTEKREAHDVARAVHAELASIIGPNALAFGDSGNGYFVLVALVPSAPTPESTTRIARLLGLLDKKFSTGTVKIDRTVGNPARLMPACGSRKCKGVDTEDRPHRLTTITAPAKVERVPLEAIA